MSHFYRCKLADLYLGILYSALLQHHLLMSKEVCVSARPPDPAPTFNLCTSAASNSVKQSSAAKQSRGQSASSQPYVPATATHDPLSYGTDNTHLIAREIARLNAIEKKRNSALSHHRKFISELSSTIKNKRHSESRPMRGRRGGRRSWALSKQAQVEQKEQEEEEDLLEFVDNLSIDEFNNDFEVLDEEKAKEEEAGEVSNQIQETFLDRQNESIQKYIQRAQIPEETKVFTFRETCDLPWDHSTKPAPLDNNEVTVLDLPESSRKIHSKQSLLKLASSSQKLANNDKGSDDGPNIVVHDKEAVGRETNKGKVVRIVLENTILDQYVKEKEKPDVNNLPYLHQCSSI
ncbi:hypothetical protein P9112_001967 [Eukaryota sp. TZLM1-RC]